MNILSVQSWVAYGHVGNAAAVFPLQRLGAEVFAVHTVQFSNHPGYGDWQGEVFAAAGIRALIDGIAARGALQTCDALLSGYMGHPATGAVILDTAARLRAANPAALYCCDPVIGDVGTGAYVRDGIEALLRDQAVGVADLLTPNQFELERLTGRLCASRAEAVAAVAALQARMRAQGPAAVLVTSLHTAETPDDALDLLAADRSGCALIRTPKLPISVNGAGDTIAALFLFHFISFGQAAAAAARAAAAVHGLLRQTAAAGSRELLIVQAQAEYVAPSLTFTPIPC
jgi:pyridoxine kinase